MTHEDLLFLGQKALIDKNGEVLVLKSPVVNIDFPGGKIEKKDRSLVASLEREVKEETGLIIKVSRPFYVSYEPVITEEFSNRLLYLVYFRCYYVGGQVEISSEHIDYQWVDKESYKRLADGSDRFKALEEYFNQYST